MLGRAALAGVVCIPRYDVKAGAGLRYTLQKSAALPTSHEKEQM